MSKIRILLIEDHELTRIGLRTALQQKAEMEIVGEAANGNDGLMMFKKLRPDIAISYCMKDIKPDHLWEALQVTHSGNIWIDPVIGRIVLEQVQKIPITPLAPSSEPKIEAYPQESSPNQEYIDTSTLTERELEVLHLIVEGCSNALIARRLHITVGTVKNHVRNVMGKLSASDRTQAAVHALRSGLVV